MAVINNIVLEDGTKPIIGFNEFECEYIDGMPSFVAEPLLPLISLASLNEGQYIVKDNSIELLMESLPKETGLYIIKPKDGIDGPIEPTAIMNSNLKTGDGECKILNVKFYGIVGAILKQYTATEPSIYLVYSEVEGTTMYAITLDLAKLSQST